MKTMKDSKNKRHVPISAAVLLPHSLFVTMRGALNCLTCVSVGSAPFIDLNMYFGSHLTDSVNLVSYAVRGFMLQKIHEASDIDVH